MKKRVLRLGALCLTLILLCTIFCGCDHIDDLRSANATMPDARTVEWNGARYIRLDALQQTAKADVGRWDYDRSVYINIDDVPTLLLPVICSEYHPTDNNVFLCRENYIEWSADIGKPIGAESEYYAEYYCREDRFEDVARQLRDGLDLTGYMYDYYDYDEAEICAYYFSNDEMAAFEKVLTPAYRWGTEVYDYEYSTPISACTDDGLIDTTKTYNILKDGSVYYIEYYPEVTDGDVWWAQEDAEYYRVPQELHGVFERMLEKSMQEQTYWDDEVLNIVESLDET